MLYLVVFLVVLMPFQQDNPDLVVTVFGPDGSPVEVRVTLWSSDNQYILAESTTDGEGVASFVSVEESSVKVMITGQLADGIPLQLIGMDSEGIPFNLGPPSNVLSLLVEPDGIIRIDPSMFVGDSPASAPTAELFPTAPIAPTVAPDPTALPIPPTDRPVATEMSPTAPAIAEAAPAPASQEATTVVDTPAPSNALFWCLGLWVFLLIGVLLWHRLRARKQEVS